MIVENPELFRNNLRNKLKFIIKNKKKSINLEIAIYNYCIQESKKKK